MGTAGNPARRALQPLTPRLLSLCVILLALTCTLGCSGKSQATSSGGSSAPTISSFSASAATITAGGSSTLSWSVSNATSISINNGVGAVTGTSVSVSPAATTTYTLTATNASGSASSTATVTVVPAPVISAFQASPATIVLGGRSTLNWTVSGASTLSIDNGVGTVTGTSIGVSPTITVIYTLTATNAAGSSTTATTTVTVTAAPAHKVLSVFAGKIGSSSNGTGTGASFSYPTGIAVDTSGNLFLADSENQTIQKITPAGVVTTFAGSPGVFGSADGSGTNATFSRPTGIAIDGSDNLYVADTNNDTIRKITSSGMVSTLAGSVGITGHNYGIGSSATFTYPTAMAVDSAGNVYVVDSANVAGYSDSESSLRKISPTGVVTTVDIGDPCLITGIAVDGGGNVYATCHDNNILIVNPAGVVTEFAGSPSGGSADGTGTAAGFTRPIGIAIDTSGNLYVADTGNDTIRKIAPGGVVTTVAGSAGMLGNADGTGAAARFNDPMGIAVDSSGNLYVTDSGNRVVRKITPAGVVTSLAGSSTNATGSADGTGSAARFNYPSGTALDSSGNLYVADTANHTIRKITPAGVVTTLAGLAGSGGHVDGAGSAARLNLPTGIAADANGNLYVITQFYAHQNRITIRKITSAGVVSTLEQSPNEPSRMIHAMGVAVDPGGNLYVTESVDSGVWKVTPAGAATLFAGGNKGSADGTGLTASFNMAVGIAIDSSGNLYVTDANSNTIRKITPAGVVTTLAGLPGVKGSNDGTASAASFNKPLGIAVDANGNLYVADYGNNAIREITPAGVVTTIISGSNVDGTVSNVALNGPVGISVDSAGVLYITAGNGVLTFVP